MAELWVVSPVYNESSSIEDFVKEWHPAIGKAASDFTFCLINDGSTDDTLQKLRQLEPRFPGLRIVDKPNSGHGQSCLHGYRLALEGGAAHVFQIDSDGQCDPGPFHKFWEERHRHSVIYGQRHVRDDGIIRAVISKMLSLLLFILTGRWIPDANVPYRLMNRPALSATLPGIPSDFRLANVMLTVLQSKAFHIRWIPIRFRSRTGRPASTRLSYFIKEAITLTRQYLHWAIQ